ncbi:MAG TPA: peptidoglycan-binding protein [Crinalium sp.]
MLSIALLASRHAPAGSQEQNANPSPQPTATPSSPASSPRPLLQTGSQGAAVEELQALLKLLGFYSGSVDGLYQPSTAAAVAAFQTAAGLHADGIVGPATWNRLLPPSPPVTNGGAVSAFPSPATTAPVAASTASPATTSPAGARPTPSVSPPASPAPSPSPVATSPTPAQQATPSPHATPGPPLEQPALIDFPILRLGVRGPAVSRLQQRLRAAGFFSGSVDGVFGPETQTAVKAAQRHYGLNPDGIVGPATWTALMQ